MHVLAVSGWSIREFNFHRENITELEPDLVVVQVGIVECSRRILSARAKRTWAAVPGGGVATKFIHDRRRQVIRLRNRLRMDTRLFTTDEFRRELAIFVAAVTGTGGRLLVLEIPSFGRQYEALNFPLINEDIALFNSVLREFGAVPMLPRDADLESVWVSPTVHLTQDGHRLAAAHLERLVETAIG